MTAQLSSPKLAAQMTALSVKRPSIATLKRKMSTDEETASPTSLDELTSTTSSSSSADESCAISPKKKIKAEGSSATISAAMNKWEASAEKSSSSSSTSSDEIKVEPKTPVSSAPATPSAAYVPFTFNAAPATPLDDEELEILNYFLA